MSKGKLPKGHIPITPVEMDPWNNPFKAIKDLLKRLIK